MVASSELRAIRAHERMDYKRCQKKWYWNWRLGLAPINKGPGALDLGTWVHLAFQSWYQDGSVRNAGLVEAFNLFADMHIQAYNRRTPKWHIERAEELAALGATMMEGYVKHYGDDPDVAYVIGTEIPLRFSFGQAEHGLKPDMVYVDREGLVWLMEHKTATTISTDHLTIDDQARPYGAMAERALRKLGLIKPRQRFAGIMYNFLRKAIPDERETNEKGERLNKNGTVSKRQSPPNFVRHPVTMTSRAKAIALRRVHAETLKVARTTRGLKSGTIHPDSLFKTPTKDCPKYCNFFKICELEEQGGDIRDMQQMMFVRRDPYAYAEEED
jgi:PD-(D/E)XK nuclease superfamily